MCCCFLLLPVLTVLTGTVEPVAGFSNGKVGVACGDMTPQHGYEPSPDPPPYSITVDKPTFRPGDNITGEGFLIEARDAGKLDLPAVGFFILTDPRQSQLLQCGHTQGCPTCSRTAAYLKVCLICCCSVTVVHDYEVYWVRIAGPVVSLRGATVAPHTVAPPTVAPPTVAPHTVAPSGGCGLSKSCLRDPVGCHPESDPHCFFLSFTADGAGRSVMFEVSGPAEGYVSFALSLDKWMGDDDVYLCVSDGGGVSISAAHVSGRTPPELETEDAVWGRAWRLADGVIQCRFHRNILLQNRFDLNQSYFLFLAHGRSHRGLIHRHHHQPLISTDQKVITGRPEDLIGSRSPLLIKVHGVLMLTVWMWTVNTAVFVARHYKHCWPDTTVLGQRLWFQIHRTMMLLAVVLTSVAFTLPFIYRRGWSEGASSHPYIGCAVMALCVIQPDFNNSLTPGTAAQILSTVCVFLGAAQQALLLPSPWSPSGLTAWLLWILLAELLLLIHRRRGTTV
uniref:Ferric chelate reductase 1 n=1 Tax=Seriola lalandi dorsalis TaxID=1841481 RepID=A0A3B4XG49_SERLL